MAYRLTVSDRAVREIGEAYEWYEEQLRGLGVEFIDALGAQLQLITQTPLLFPEIRRGIRRTLLSIRAAGLADRRKARPTRS